VSRLVTPEVEALLDVASVGPAVPEDVPAEGGAVAAVDARLSALWA
jgi:hypothetical protein